MPATLLSLAAALVWLPQAAVIAWVLSALLAGQDAQPLTSGAIFLALAALRTLLNHAAQRALAATADRVVATLRAEILGRETLAAAPSAQAGPGALATLAAEKLETLRPFVMRYRPARMRTLAVPLVILGFALWHSWAVALVLLAAGPLIPVFMALVGRAAKEASQRQMVEVGALSDLLVDRLAALSDLRLIGAGARVVDGFAAASDNLRRRTMAVLRVAFLSSTALELFAALGIALVAIWVGFTLLGQIGWGGWGGRLTPFAGIYLVLLAPEFFMPLRELAAAWHDKAACDAVMQEVESWREESRPTLLGQGAPALATATTMPIRLTGVTARRGAQTISYPDLDIRPGERIAIKGRSGTGKTTLLRLLAGLERPASGRIEIGDATLDDDSADALRARIGWMPQAPHFLNRSLRHNIGFGRDLDPDLLDAARIGAVIKTLPKGTATPLGERGAGLSGGEARRVMLARALHADPDILLADEPTADLDRDTAAQVIAGLLRFAETGGTLLISTHDPSVMEQMDRVIDLDATSAEVPA